MRVLLILSLLMASTQLFAFEKKSRIVKVMTYNIRGLPWPAATDRGRYKAIGKLIKKRKPDFVLLQEAFTRKSKRKVSKYAGYKNNIHGPGGKLFRDLVGSGISILSRSLSLISPGDKTFVFWLCFVVVVGYVWWC